MKNVRITWKAKWWWFKPERLEFHPAEGKLEELKLVESLPAREKLGLRSKSAADLIGNAIDAYNRLELNLVLALVEDEQLCVLFEMGDGPVHVPWEAALLRVRDEKIRNRYVPVRVGRGPLGAPIGPRAHPLRVLILLGDAGEFPNKIYPDREAADVERAWEALDPEAQARIARPKSVKLADVDLSALLRSEPADILWYCGHGRADGDPALLAAPGVWLPVGDFAALIPKESPPLCCVLWACDLGQAPTEGVAPAPEIHDALVGRGVKATLAMQSRISDRIARNMANAYFEGLAVGMSFERAAAYSRRCGSVISEGSLDWAAPAFWSTLKPAHNLSWAASANGPILDRFLAWTSVRSVQGLPDIPSNATIAWKQALTWRSNRRTVIEADVEAQSTPMALAQLARAAVALSDTPIFLRLSNNEWRASISDWAASVLSWAESNSPPSPLSDAIFIAQKQPEEGLRRLIMLEKAMIVLVAPATGVSTEFARYLADISLDTPDSSSIVVVSPARLEDEAVAKWPRDILWSANVDLAMIEDAIQHDLPTLTALAVLDLPFSERELETLGFTRNRYPKDSPLLFEGTAGPVLNASTRRIVLERADVNQRRAAHAKCLEFLGRQATVGAERLDLERLRHLVALGESENALALAGSLIERFGYSDRYASIIECFDRLSPLRTRRMDLQSHELLHVARAYVRLHKMAHARRILWGSTPKAPLELALHHALLSEVEKSSGIKNWREEALRHIDTAIELCARETKSDDASVACAAEVDLAHWNMNRARLLQYLFYDSAGAIATYEEILARPSYQRNTLLLASARRNLAEGMLSQAGLDASVFQRVEREIQEAEDSLQYIRSRDPLLAELAYQRVKLAETRGDTSQRCAELLQVCVKRAHDTGNGMTAAIAAARLFWLGDDRNVAEWRRIERRLAPYHWHGWALRTLVNGRIRMARTLAQAGDAAAALTLLRQSKIELDARPGYDRGTDRRRIAETLGGIAVVSDDANERESARAAAAGKDWIPQWLESQGFSAIDDAWKMGS
ncbi:CHAT domain-containing protein [Paraburkholderia sp. EG287B]|uniref:CHAT domain-containing protein n=1 Tax=Paraburkholderia sp. EG287B TaxID=3237010 RepID=UPI0034D29A2E